MHQSFKKSTFISFILFNKCVTAYNTFSYIDAFLKINFAIMIKITMGHKLEEKENLPTECQIWYFNCFQFQIENNIDDKCFIDTEKGVLLQLFKKWIKLTCDNDVGGAQRKERNAHFCSWWRINWHFPHDFLHQIS